MAEKEQFVISKAHLWEYIGDLSQDVLECSYNEDDIRSMWRRGTIDHEVATMLKTYDWRLEGWRREDGRYSDLLTAYVIEYGGWSPHWGYYPLTEEQLKEWGDEEPPKNEVSPLSPEEQAIVDAFQAKYEIIHKE
jgi:hypothetical protein